MRQEALKRHLKGKSFPITSMKTLTPVGEGAKSLESILSSEQLKFLSYNQHSWELAALGALVWESFAVSSKSFQSFLNTSH